VTWGLNHERDFFFYHFGPSFDGFSAKFLSVRMLSVRKLFGSRPRLNVVGCFWAHKLLSNSFNEKFRILVGLLMFKKLLKEVIF
jgi:hypothetical protein